MPTRKKCRHCNTDNSADVLYCVACGKYLASIKSNDAESLNMRGYGLQSTAVSPRDLIAFNSPSHNDASNALLDKGFVVICPVCQHHIPTSKDVLPMSCSGCGYFFQVGLDKVVKEGDIQDSAIVTSKESSPLSIDLTDFDRVSLNTPQKIGSHKSPMPTVNIDNSQLRLFWMNRINEMPIQIPHKGVTLGSEGVLLKNLPSDTLFMIWHTPAGWYLRSIRGIVLYNGTPINLNIDRRLLNNDSLIIGNEQFRVEVI